MRYLITIVSFFLSFHANAQVYPVQTTVQLLPPYTPYLSDYTTAGAQKMMVQVRLNDPTATSYQCKLRITIEGVGITLRTKQSIFLNPIILQGGGIPQMFYGEDLEEYFRPANLDFSGFSRAQYEKGASLPEGVYRFTIEVLDYNRNTVVSNKAMSVAWMVLNDPPMLNLPARETKIQQINPTNIPFTWTPRHTGSPNAAFTTEYIFRLVEMAPGTPSSLAQNAIQSQPTLYELTTNQTQIVYGMAEPALIPGRKYAWQVQAKDVDGRDLFKNQGRSEVYVFQFGDALGMPENMYLQSANSSALTIRWEQNIPATSPQKFRVSYRPHQKRSTDEWYESQTTEQWKAITQLKPDTEYEVKVRVEQGTLAGEYNSMQVYRTVPLGANEFVCKSDVPPVPIPTGALPLFQLSINDTIKAAGYNVLVRKVSGSNGTYSGEGAAIVPWFNAAKVRVTFKNISVNSNFWLTAGVIESVWDADSNFLLNVPSATPTTPGSTPKTGDIPITIAATDELIKISGAAIAAVTKDAEGNIVVSTTDGKQQVLEKGKSYSVADDIGNGYVIDKEGNVAKTTAAQAIAAAERGNRKYNLALKFEKGKGEFGFDGPPQDAMKDLLASYYQAMDDGKQISWKAIADGMPDVVSAVVERSTLDAKKLNFEMNGTPVKATVTDKIEINITGQGNGMTSELIAKAEGSDEVVGKLNVINYKEITKNLVLVSVNGKELVYASSLQAKLNIIYKQAAVRWNVTMDSIQVLLDQPFDDTSDEALSNYTDDMKKVINAYTKNHALAPDTYYLFLVDKPKSITKAGYLPRKKQAGFLFVNNLTSEELTIKTVAHELGHGAFRLEHTFKEFPSLSKESTNNLMDYRQDGTYLYKYQWDYIHDPEAVLSLFEHDEDGAYETDGHYSTVYLVCLMLGMSDAQALQLAVATEDPDTDIHSEYDFELDETWAFPEEQTRTHSLTEGFHGVEELVTALKFIYTDKNDTKELGRLLHRYGDTYAHTRIGNVKDWTNQKGDEINYQVDTWVQYINSKVKTEGYKFVTNDQIQKKYLNGRTLERYLSDVYSNKPTDRFSMYGAPKINFFGFRITLEHASSDGALPDYIYLRPKWYLTYVKNIATLLAYKFNLDEKKLDINLFNKMVNFATNEPCSLKGIIDYEIAKKRNKNYFEIPVFYANRFIAGGEAIFNTDYLQVAKTALEKTKKYMLIVDKVKISDDDVLELTGDFKLNANGIYNTMSYQVRFK